MKKSESSRVGGKVPSYRDKVHEKMSKHPQKMEKKALVMIKAYTLGVYLNNRQCRVIYLKKKKKKKYCKI